MGNLINPNDPRAKRTRKALQQSFIELLKQKEFDSISIQDITDHAEMNRSTFYSHFQDKYEILELTLNNMFSNILMGWIPTNSEFNGQTLIRNLILALCQWQVETGQSINKKSSLSHYIEENTRKQLFEIIYSCLEKTTSDTLDDKRQVEIVAIMISSSIYSIVLNWNHNQKTEEPEELVQRTLPFVSSLLHMIGLSN